MTLIVCVHCNKSISNLSHTCLNCGCPSKHSLDEIAKAAKKKKEEKEITCTQALYLAVAFIILYYMFIF